MAVPVECFFLPCRWQCHIATFLTSWPYFGTNLLEMRRYDTINSVSDFSVESGKNPYH